MFCSTPQLRMLFQLVEYNCDVILFIDLDLILKLLVIIRLISLLDHDTVFFICNWKLLYSNIFASIVVLFTME